MHMMCSANKHRKEGQSNLRASSQIMATSIFHRPISGKSWPIYTEQGKLLSFGKESCCSDLSRLKELFSELKVAQMLLSLLSR